MSQACVLEVEVCSLYEAAFEEARCHRWIESQKRGYDVGNNGFLDWYNRFWWNFLRYRHLEHLLGEYRWSEFASEAFGVLVPLIESGDSLALEIIDQYRQGCENLDILNWALRNRVSLAEVRERLALINMNDARIDPRFN
ncbi:MAG: hypothetical protein ISQ06_01550 [Planctomycetaceae bacterium]|jgi:hypothetical protein|nr:hypothetical protein [Planctomycetaceae bacterium]